MLTSLYISQFTIVQHLEIDFHNEMTAFTGETGAGKSIIIDALMLALGERTDTSQIRPGAKQCDITATFHIDKKSISYKWLQDHDIECDDNEIILRRVISIEGKSRAYINGKPFPLQKVKELSLKLVDIHGQHQHQSLLLAATHREQLDRYGQNEILLKEVSTLYHEIERVQKELKSHEVTNSEKIALLKFQIAELNDLNLQPDEYEILNKEHNLLHNAALYIQTSTQISDLLNNDDENNVLKVLHHILQLLSNFPKDNQLISNTTELINNALIQCTEASNEIKSFITSIELNPERLNEVDERMSLLHQMARKYQVEITQLAEHFQLLQAELDAHLLREQNIITLTKRLEDLHIQYTEMALKLRSERLKAAKNLEKEISASIKTLGMPKGFIEIAFTKITHPTAHGLDKIEYQVCTNPGMPLRELGKVASGGELSRISLAIQMITAQKASTPTLIFDEVDVGIGGGTAHLVGKHLRNLASKLQVLCVTHQPQVAACAHHHVKVTKQANTNETLAQIEVLQPDDKINELARMLGGMQITEQTKSNARELVELSV